MEFHELVVLLSYASLLLELVVFPVPSEASTYQLLTREAPRAPEQDRLSRARERPRSWKLLGYFLPTATVVVLFLIPLVWIAFPATRDWFFPLRSLENDGVRLLGMAVIVLGRAIAFLAALQLRQVQSAGSGLAARGLFNHSRNPILIGMYTFYLGLFLVSPCWVLLLGFFPYVINMHRRVLMEESHLSHSFGEDYTAYRRSVPRYLLRNSLR